MQREGKLRRLLMFLLARPRRFSHTERILPRRFVSFTDRRALIFLKVIRNRSCTNLFPRSLQRYLHAPCPVANRRVPLDKSEGVVKPQNSPAVFSTAWLPEVG